MIGQDGSLSITVPGQKVTWFQFLQASRLATSEMGGWNSKTHWIELGLDQLHPLLVKQWTKRSLKDNARPKPRSQDVILSHEDSGARMDAERRGMEALKSRIDGLLENKLNAVLHSNKNWPTADWGNFLGYEVPLADESTGQLKIDLIGAGKDSVTGDGFVSLVELKQAESPKNSPLMALTEAICYAVQIKRCKELRKKILNGDFKTIRLILAAPEEYWSCWKLKKHPDCSKKMNAIVESVSEILSPSFKLTLEMVSLLYENGEIKVEPICSE